MASCTRCFSELSALAVFCPACGQPHAPDFDSLINQTLAERYLMQQRLTNGGLSAVFLATDLHAQQPVIIKLSDPQHLTRRELTYTLDTSTARAYWAEMLERMRNEAEMLLSLRHPNIVRLHGTALLREDLRYLVFEYLQGETLQKTLQNTLLRQPRLPLGEALRLTLSIADALEHVHARGIVHRDVNPNNVMLCVADARPGETASPAALKTVKLIDFGIAKFPQPPGAPPFTMHSTLRGTVAYAAPEQCQNQPLDARSDIYSLGVMLYEMTTGQRPFAGRTPTEIALQQIQATPLAPRQLNPELSPDLETVILRALAKNRNERQVSAGAFAAELRAAARRIVIDLPAPAAAPLLITSPVEPPLPAPAPITARTQALSAESFHFASLERAARPRRILPRVLAACAMLAIVLSAKVGTLDTQRLARLFNDTDVIPLEALTVAPRDAMTNVPVIPAVEPNAADAFEMTTQPLRTLASTLATQMKWPGTARKTAAVVKRGGTAFSPPWAQLSPQVVATASSIPPYATPPAAYQLNAALPEVAQAPAPREATFRPPANTANNIGNSAPQNPAGSQSSQSMANSSDPDAAEPDAWQPRLIAWNGAVYGERLLRIELPGKPGRVEIPPAFRRRVGIVEPPQAGNDWRCVRLRVIGNGAVNLVIRWWPK